MSSPTPASEPVKIIVVDSEACHFCEDAQRVLVELAARYPLTIETLSLRTTAGQELMGSHRAALSPLVLLDGDFFSHGRLPRRKLTKVLHGRYGDPADQSARKAG